MAATVLEIADAVVAALNGASLSQSFAAERLYVPVHELDGLADLTVSVVPNGLSMTGLDRTPRHLIDYVVDIGIQQRIGGTSAVPATPTQVNARGDALMALTEEVVDLFRGQPLAAGGRRAWCVAAENRPIFRPDHFDEMRVFTSVVSLTFRLGR